MITSITRILAIAVMLLPGSPAIAAVILQYHHVSEDTPAATSVTPEQFEGHLERLSEEGFRVLALDRLVEEVRDGLEPEKKVAAITFDDGYRTVYETALPMLEKRGWRAAVFVTTQGIREGWQEMMTPEMLRDARERGHLIVNHTRSHPHMVRMHRDESRDLWRKRMRGEIVGARRALEQWLGAETPRMLAWPYGEHDPALRTLAAELGYVAFGQQSGALGEYTDWQQVPRIPVNRHYAGWESLGNKVGALPLPVTRTEPENGITAAARPELVLHLAGDWKGRVNCFAGGDTADVSARPVDGDTLLHVRSRKDLEPGRQRYNCTATAGDGRYYWYSHLWMRRTERGWYAEP
jgi:peptidoglycan/xylan/chitin deacetylase (PgdA/CDA1 family)